MGKKSAEATDDPKPEIDWAYIEKVLMTRDSLTWTALAQLMGVDTDTLSRSKKSGKATKDTVAKLAHALGVKPVELYTAAYRQFLEAQTRAVATPPSPPITSLPPASPPPVVRKIRQHPVLLRHAPKVLFGREKWLDALDAAWAKPHLNVYTLVAWGGVGKTALVAHWVSERLAAKVWPGVERYFDWSFYSQGTGDSRQTSSDLFIHEALKFFDDPDPVKGNPWERGERLAGLIRQHRTLLVLDGIEPLQYPETDQQAGRIRDPALEALVQSLAADNPGLVVVTTREHLTNIESQATADEEKLDRLPKEAAIELLRHMQLVGTDEEFEAAWKAADGHALTLQLLGRYIADAFPDKDIRHFQEVRFEEADQERQGRSAFRVMAAYERWLASARDDRRRELDLLRLTGLFDRPITLSCLKAILSPPAIHGLTYHLLKLQEPKRNIALKRLADIDLLSVTTDVIDVHPLIREYFAVQMKLKQPDAFKEAHSRLFDHLCQTTPYRPDTLEGLAPLYQAVAHGCLAGRHQETRDKVYTDRILRGTGPGGFYSRMKLGAIGADLGAVAAFFDVTWSQVSSNLSEYSQGWILNEAATALQALGRMNEALSPMQAGLEAMRRMNQWKQVTIITTGLSYLELKLGQVTDAVSHALQSIALADQFRDENFRVSSRASAAGVLHQAGRRDEAGSLFTEAERMQKKEEPQFGQLFSLLGYQYCDWLLAPVESALWRSILHGAGIPHAATLSQ